MKMRWRPFAGGVNKRAHRREVKPSLQTLEGRELLANILNVYTQTGPGSLEAAITTVDANPQIPYTVNVQVPFLYDTEPLPKVTAGCVFQFNSAVDDATVPVLDIAAPGQTVSISGLIVNYAPSSSPAITIEDLSSVTADNCTFAGAGYGPGSTGNGTAILVTQESSLTLTNSVVQGFDYGVNVQNAVYYSNNVSYTNNGVTALVVAPLGTATEQRADYSGNGSQSSAAIQNSGILSETGSTITGNQGPSGWGVVTSNGGELVLTTTTDSGSSGATAVYAVNGKLIVNQGAAVQNNLDGALFTKNEVVSITNGTISGNETSADFNVVFDTSTVGITDTTITGNVQASTGPYGGNSVVTVDGYYNNFSGNGPQGDNPTGPYYPPTYYPVYPVVPPVVVNPYPVYTPPVYSNPGTPVSGNPSGNQGGQTGSGQSGNGKHGHKVVVHVGKKHPGSSGSSLRHKKVIPLSSSRRAHAMA